MDRFLRIHDSKRLWVLLMLGTALSSLLYSRVTLTGVENLDGVIAVLFGLYICSHPAANMVDLLFFRRGGALLVSSWRSAALWLTTNMLVLLTGWVIIFLGTTRLISRSE